MQNRFSSLVLSGGILSFVIIYFLDTIDLVRSENEVVIRFVSLGLFVLGVLLLIIHEIKKNHLPLSGLIKRDILVIIPLVLLLIATIFHRKVGVFATGFFIFMTIISLVLNKKLYRVNQLFYYVLGYVMLLFAGTVNTSKGFHFPELTYTFVLLPISFSFFDLSRNDLLRIARLFFRIVMIYLLVCIIYWWYNFLHLDVSFFSWVTQKLSFAVDMPGWKEQVRIMNGGNLPAYFFVNSWSYYSHPSYISLVLFFGLIIGFYLYYKKDKISLVSRLELTVYAVLCFFVELLMESRIGVVGYSFILAATGLYYAKLKLRMFKIAIIIYIVAGSITLLFMQDSIEGFIGDKVRMTFSTLAVNYIEDHFWWGVGTQEQHIALEQQLDLMKDTIQLLNEKLVYTHNQFLGNMVQFGVWGLIFLLILLYGIIRYAIKERSYLLQMFISVFILFMMIEEPLYTQEGITRFTVFLFFFAAINDSGKKRSCVSLSTLLDNKRKNQLNE